VTAYVVVVPSCAVTTTEISFDPTDNEIDCEATPDDTVEPFTFTDANASPTVGVTDNDVVA
jgi:hypothetical protein